MPPLDPEQLSLLTTLVEAANTVERDQRFFFMISTLGDGDVVDGPGGPYNVLGTDIHDLIDAGLLKRRGSWSSPEVQFTIAPQAHDYIATFGAVEPLAKVEDDITRQYLDAAEFRERYPAAYQRWKESADLLWSPNATDELTTIGHKTREAVQEFASALLVRHNVEGAPTEVTKTVARLRAAIEVHRERLGEARRHFLEALVAYWGEVNDLLQRQEHSGQKEGEPLSWEDGRRAVFQTAVVMYEIDRTLN